MQSPSSYHIIICFLPRSQTGQVQRWVTLTYFSRSQSPNKVQILRLRIFFCFFLFAFQRTKNVRRGGGTPAQIFFGVSPVFPFFLHRNNTLPITSQHFDAVTIFVPHILPTKVSDWTSSKMGDLDPISKVTEFAPKCSYF